MGGKKEPTQISVNAPSTEGFLGLPRMLLSVLNRNSAGKSHDVTDWMNVKGWGIDN